MPASSDEDFWSVLCWGLSANDRRPKYCKTKPPQQSSRRSTGSLWPRFFSVGQKLRRKNKTTKANGFGLSGEFTEGKVNPPPANGEPNSPSSSVPHSGGSKREVADFPFHPPQSHLPGYQQVACLRASLEEPHICWLEG